jgi:5-methylcytosine-specific restriction protein A
LGEDCEGGVRGISIRYVLWHIDVFRKRRNIDMGKMTGKKLKKLWGVDVKHALYREDGKWFHLLNSFPAALFDKHGYIIFNTKDEYINSEYLSIGEELHVSKGISNIPGYIKVA